MPENTVNQNITYRSLIRKIKNKKSINHLANTPLKSKKPSTYNISFKKKKKNYAKDNDWKPKKTLHKQKKHDSRNTNHPSNTLETKSTRGKRSKISTTKKNHAKMSNIRLTGCVLFYISWIKKKIEK